MIIPKILKDPEEILIEYNNYVLRENVRSNKHYIKENSNEKFVISNVPVDFYNENYQGYATPDIPNNVAEVIELLKQNLDYNQNIAEIFQLNQCF